MDDTKLIMKTQFIHERTTEIDASLEEAKRELESAKADVTNCEKKIEEYRKSRKLAEKNLQHALSIRAKVEKLWHKMEDWGFTHIPTMEEIQQIQETVLNSQKLEEEAQRDAKGAHNQLADKQADYDEQVELSKWQKKQLGEGEIV